MIARFFIDVAQAEIQAAVTVLDAGAGLRPENLEVAVAVARRVAQKQRAAGDGGVSEDTQIVAAAVAAVKILTPPETLRRIGEKRRVPHHSRADHVGVRDGRRLALHGERVARNRVLIRVGSEHGLREPDIGGIGYFLVKRAFDGERVALVGLQNELPLKVVDVEEKVAPTVALLVQVIGDPTDRLTAVASAERAVADEQAAPAALDIEIAVQLRRRVGRDEVDDAAHGLRAVYDLAAALENFHAAHALDRRRIVHFRLAVRREGDRNAVFQHQHLAAAVRVDPADTDIEAHRHRAGILANGHSGRAPQHFVGVERFGDLQFVF